MELRDSLASTPDLQLVWVMADRQINEKTLRFIDELGLRQHVRFLSDPQSEAIDRLGIRRENPEPIEAGVPHPTTFVLDRQGVVRFADLRTDFHIWLDPELLREVLADIP